MNLDSLHRAWKRLVWIRLLRRFHPVMHVLSNGSRMRVDLRDHYISQSLFLYGEYEGEFQRLMSYIGLEGGVCLDIGANIGVYSLAMSRLAGGAGSVYAFEPEAHNFHLLQYNLQANSIVNVKSIRAAVGDAEGTCQITLSDNNLGDHQVFTGQPGTKQLQDVPMVTIDKVLQDLPDEKVKFIKVDVQGYESHVIRGMVKTLKRNPDAILLIEISPSALKRAGSSVTELMQRFQELDLSGWEIHDYRITPIAESWVYELIRGDREENFLLSQNPERLLSILKEFYTGPPAPTALRPQ